MSQTTLEPVSDQEFARQVGIRKDLTPRLSLTKKLVLAAALLLAASSSLVAGLFQRGTPTRGDSVQASVTQCPMTGNPSKPTR